MKNILKKNTFSSAILLLVVLFTNQILFARQFDFKTGFSAASTHLQTVERGSCKVVDGVLKSTDACAKFGNPEWKN